MNQNQYWFAIAVVTMVCSAAAAAAAQTFNNNGGRNEPLYRNQLQPITRQGFDYIRQMGGRQDEEGSYQNPVPTESAFGARLQDGTYQAPMQWNDQGTSVLYDVQDGQIVRQDYYWGKQN